MTGRVPLVFLALFSAAIAAGCSPGPRCPTCPAPVVLPPPPPPPTPPPPPPPSPRFAVTRIMAFGDSLTEGESSGTLRMQPSHDPATAGVLTSYPAQLLGMLVARYTDQAQAFRVFNVGIGGRKAVDDVRRFDDALKTYTPQVAILLHGVNDLNTGIAIAEIISAIEEMVREGQRRGVHVFLSTLPAQRPGGRRAFAVARIAPYNEELRDSARDLGVPLVDVHPHITLDMLTPDGLHITPAGNAKLAEVYFNALKARYEIAAP